VFQQIYGLCGFSIFKPKETQFFVDVITTTIRDRIAKGDSSRNDLIDMMIRCPYQHFMCAFFVQKCFAQLFSNYSFGFAIFWRKNIGAKAACKMLMKLTTEL